MQRHRDRTRRGRRFLALAIGALVALMPATTFAKPQADPLGDYGDAPDGGGFRFPTRYLTSNSRVGGHGANHRTTGLEMLGTTVSAEFGASDPADPDGVPNLVNADGGDDGLIGVLARAYGSPFTGGPPLTDLTLGVRVTIPAGAPAGPRFLNILLDVNRDGQWRYSARDPEWVVENVAVIIPPGTSQIVQLPIGAFDVTTTDPASVMWMRITLTRSEIAAAPFVGLGGWDGSGDFAFGETEDYVLYSGSTLVPPPWVPPCDCRYTINKEPKVLLLDHGTGGTLTWTITVRGANCPAPLFDDLFETEEVSGFGQLGGGAKPGEIGVPVFGPSFISPLVNQFTLTVPISSLTVHNTGGYQMFGVRARFHGTCPDGSFAFAASVPKKVVIAHPTVEGDVFFSILNFGGAFVQPPGITIPLPTSPGPPMGYVIFANNQPTPGTIRAMQIRNHNPFGFPQTGTLQGVLPVTTFLDVDFRPDPNAPLNQPDVQTTISGLFLAGYTDQQVLQAGIANEATLRAQKMPLDPASYEESIRQITEQVGLPAGVDTINNIVFVNQVRGFSIWTLGRPGLTLTDCNANGVPDVQEIGLNGRLDCFNKAAPPNGLQPVSGGPNLVLDTCECVGDWNRDGIVVPIDAALFIIGWSIGAANPGNLDSDLDCNGVIEPVDIAIFINSWFGGLTNPAANGC